MYIRRGFEYPCSFTERDDGPFWSANSVGELSAYGVPVKETSNTFRPKRIVFSESFIVGAESGTLMGVGYYAQ